MHGDTIKIKKITYVFMSSSWYFSPILNKSGVSEQIFIKSPQYQISQKSAQCKRRSYYSTDEQTNWLTVITVICPLRDCEKAHRKVNEQKRKAEKQIQKWINTRPEGRYNLKAIRRVKIKETCRKIYRKIK